MFRVRIVNAAVVAASLLALPAAAADVPDIDAICAKTACRTGGYFAVVSVDAAHFIGVNVSRSPYLLEDGAILLFPGETLAVTFAVDGDTLGKPISAVRYAPHLPLLIARTQGDKPAANPDDATLPVVLGKMPADEVASLPPNTLLISYGQFKPEGPAGMVLTLEHNLPHTLKLDAVITEISTAGYKQHASSTCPVLPKIWDNESWPYPLGPIILAKVRFQPDSGDIVCN